VMERFGNSYDGPQCEPGPREFLVGDVLFQDYRLIELFMEWKDYIVPKFPPGPV
jgi:hypothetical protein